MARSFGLIVFVLCFSMLVLAPVGASAVTYPTDTLSGQTNWTKANNPYVINGTYFVGRSGVLVIEPGVVVKFTPNAMIIADGQFIVGDKDNANAELVYFTSIKDDTVAGDTNADATTTLPSPGDWRMLLIRMTGTSSIDRAVVRYAGQDGNNAIFNDGATLRIGHTWIGDNLGAGIYNNTIITATTEVHDSEITRNNIGLHTFKGGITVNNSSIHDNTTIGAINEYAPRMNATQNWWGSVTGPYQQFENASGTGEKIGSYIDFNPWLGQDPFISGTTTGTSTPSTCTENCFSNILFLPGIMGSRLFEESTSCGLGSVQERWVSTSDCDHARLALDIDGKSVHDLYSKEGEYGVIDDTFGFNIYQSFMNDLADWKQDGTVNDYALVPYDWRLSLEDILQNGASTSGKLSYTVPQGFDHSYLYIKLRELANTSKSNKVTIIAHSNGGLLTKALIQKLKDNNDPLYERIDKIIFVAVPQAGTPETVGSVLHGSSIGNGVVMSAKRVRDLLNNMPFAYNLLPTQAYVGTGTPLIEFDGFTANSPFAKYGRAINSISSLDDYLLGGDGRVPPQYADLDHAQIANTSLLANARAVHDVLDNWSPASTTEIYQIAGWGISTISGLEYKQNKVCVKTETTPALHLGAPITVSCSQYADTYRINDKVTINGDGTVMSQSAHLIPPTSKTHKYWVDLSRYNLGLTQDRKHKDIFEVTPIAEFLKSIVREGVILNQYILESNSDLSPSISFVKYQIHSPLNLNVYDDKGNHTGYSTTTGLLETQIDGSQFFEIGESKVVVVDASVPHKIVLDAYASGSFTLDIEKLSGDHVVSSTTFMGIPTATTTVATLEWLTDQQVGTTTKLSVDYDGDNVVDLDLSAITNSVVLIPQMDVTPPKTEVTTSGTVGSNGWYTSNVILTLTATDTQSGVSTTSYSLDNGVTWNAYISPIEVSADGKVVVLFRSADIAGNIEEVNSLNVLIDRSAPEVIVYMSTSTQDLIVEGKDNHGSTTVMKDVSGNYLVTDQAGHITKLYFTKSYSGKILTYARVTGIQYDSQSKIALPASFLYVWDTKSNPSTLVSQTVAADGNYLVQALYDKRKNKTTIVVLKKNIPVQTSVYTGLKVVNLQSKNGVMGYGW